MTILLSDAEMLAKIGGIRGKEISRSTLWRLRKDDPTFPKRSVLKTVERIFNLPALPSVIGETDLADMFEAGVLP